MSIAKIDLVTKEIQLFVEYNSERIEQILDEPLPKKQWFKPKNLGAVLIENTIASQNMRIGKVIGLYNKTETQQEFYHHYKQSFKGIKRREELHETK